MTEALRGSAPHRARVQRAEALARSLPASAELLNFYRRIAAFQEELFARLSTSRVLQQSTSLQHRTELDLTELLGGFRDFLALVQTYAPSSLAHAATQLRQNDPQTWAAQLNSYWQSDQLDAPDRPSSDALAQFFPRAFLQPIAEFLASALPMPPFTGASRLCPLCGSPPLLGVLRPEGDGGKRFLLCSFCSREWEFRRILCAACGEEDEQKLPVYVAEQLPHIRVESC
ncbi:MAG TPA: formate dehydrogenase accessory protein FdhE, partial [Terriglobales bacterium]|nr:formate dehydrogenase accessory protein FdhE [Terriglobales bacterium]